MRCLSLSYSKAGCWHQVLGEGALGDAVQPEQQQGSPQLQRDQRCLKDAGSRAAPCLGSADLLVGLRWPGTVLGHLHQ